METITVELGERGYDVTVGDGLLGRLEDFFAGRAWKKAALVTDGNVGPMYARTASGRLEAAGLEPTVVEVPAGEGSKSARTALGLVDSFIEAGLSRSDVVVALGGGVVGDLAGFAASVFKRGVAVVQVPTSLMAQVDSSIGGKTAVNLPVAKNQVGTVWQPAAVVCDVAVLGTLAAGEFASGMAEVAKYSFLTARPWGSAFRRDASAAAGADSSGLVRLVADCVREKAELVSADERDEGVRHHLNYGHTLGHALETAAGYSGRYAHGEAVAVGMVFAALVSEAMGIAPPGLADGHREVLASLGLPVAPFPPSPPYVELAPVVALDKKSAGDVVMVLLEGPGAPRVERGLARSLMEECYRELCRGAPE